MPNISDILRSFDRKERAWLVRNAISGLDPKLDPEFLGNVSERLKVDPPLRSDRCWWGMDYHLDWLSAAIHAFKLNAFSAAMAMWPEENNKGLLKHTVEDIDLVIADESRIILIEAKAFGDWDREQLVKKLDRLRRYTKSGLVSDMQGHYSVRIFLLLMSIRNNVPIGLDWGPWTEDGVHPVWMRLQTSLQGVVRKTVRCNEAGDECKDGTYWKTGIERF